MNKLSWLIYLSDATSSVSDFLIFLSAVSVILAGVCCAIYLSTIPKYNDSGRELTSLQLEANRTFNALSISICKRAIWFFLISGILGAIMPNKSTVLMIAASEVGERMMSSQAVQGVVDPGLDFLKAWIRQQTEDITKNAEKNNNNTRPNTR